MLEEFTSWGYIGLFISSFLAATVLPFSSEVVYIALIASGLDAWICTLVASAGNWIGGMSCYYLGMMGKMEWIERYLKVEQTKIDRLQHWLQKKGAVMAFFSFLPVVGDVIAVALGYMRSNLAIVSISMLLGKFTRYLVIMYSLEKALQLF